MLGLGFATVQANAQTILQSAPEQMRGRVLSMGQAISGSVTFLAAALVGILSQQVGIQATFMISGLVAIVAGTLIISRRSLCLSR
jgi:sugar phosphate permease